GLHHGRQNQYQRAQHRSEHARPTQPHTESFFLDHCSFTPVHVSGVSPQRASSWLLPTPEPYYNPAKLEKRGTHVKQKESLEGIKILGPHRHGGPPAAHLRSGAPPRHFFVRAPCLGNARSRRSAAHPKPLSSLH